MSLISISKFKGRSPTHMAGVALLAGAFAVQPLGLPILSLSTMATGVAHAQDGPRSLADLSERLIDSVVNISTSQTISGGERNVRPPQVPEGSPFQEFFDEFFENMPDGEGPGGNRNRNRGERQVQSLGSGFVIDAQEGIIITNNHVIADADEIVANFADGTQLVAELIGTDPKTDIAVLKVDASQKELKAVSFAEINTVRVGDWVLAIGNPFGLGGSVSADIAKQCRNITQPLTCGIGRRWMDVPVKVMWHLTFFIIIRPCCNQPQVTINLHGISIDDNCVITFCQL